jgi:multidrug efflux pump subunit AcrA (membrane-fusion protein)
VLIGGAVLLAGAITFGLRWFAHRPPSVARSELWIGTVERSPLALGIQGNGTLVPIDFRWASAPTAARVDKVLVLPGAKVEADTILVELSNPDAELAALNADRDAAQAEAELARLAAQLDGTTLAQESTVAGLDSDVVMANRRSAMDTEMEKKGVIPRIEKDESVDRATQLAGRRDFEKKRLGALQRGNAAQLEAQRGQVDRLKALADFHHKQLELLHVRAGQAGVVQQVAVEAGQTVAVGANLAKIIAPDHLQAHLRIPETAMQDVTLGLHAKIDTRAGIVDGEVTRVDPAAQNGAVTVDIKLLSPLPPSARVDQNIDGTIELGGTQEVMHMPRPAIGEAHQSVSMFKLDGSGEAHRVTVTFGRAALKDIEIASGLHPGDQVVLSDTAQWQNTDRIRIE